MVAQWLRAVTPFSEETRIPPGPAMKARLVMLLVERRLVMLLVEMRPVMTRRMMMTMAQDTQRLAIAQPGIGEECWSHPHTLASVLELELLCPWLACDL